MSETYEGLGEVEKVLGNNNYLVQVAINDNVRTILCHLSGKMRRFRISVIAGDQVTVEIPSPYDRGRITFRGKKEEREERDAKKKNTRKRPKGRGGRR